MTRTTVALAAGLSLCALSVASLQQRFDAGDHAKAERLVRGLGASGRTERFDAYVARSAGANPNGWSSEITGGCRGVARVSYVVPGGPSYAWEVDLPLETVHPTRSSAAGERLLREFVGGSPASPEPR